MHLGYFANLDSRAMILMEADVDGLRELGDIFRSFAAGRIKKLVIHRLPFVRAHHATELRASCGSHDRGVRRDGDGHSFLWERSAAGWRVAADKLAVLAQAPQASRQYFDAECDDVAVVVSKGEYGENWWNQHG